ncbi:hypothetical protein ACFL5V_09115, partial [Fibrobacterota bacterium]
ADKALARLRNGLSDANWALELALRDRKKKDLISSKNSNRGHQNLFDWSSVEERLSNLEKTPDTLQDVLKNFINNTPILLHKLKQVWISNDRFFIELHAKDLSELASTLDAHPLKCLAILSAAAAIIHPAEEAGSLFTKLDLAMEELTAKLQEKLLA